MLETHGFSTASNSAFCSFRNTFASRESLDSQPPCARNSTLETPAEGSSEGGHRSLGWDIVCQDQSSPLDTFVKRSRSARASALKTALLAANRLMASFWRTGRLRPLVQVAKTHE
jgi:hypothetical protein